MPVLPAKPCSCTGCTACVGRCPNRSRQGGRCDACRATQPKVWKHTPEDQARNNAFYTSKRWRGLRARVLREERWCRICRIKPSTQVDHIVPRSEGGDAWERANLQGLCKPCHDRKTRGEIARRQRLQRRSL